MRAKLEQVLRYLKAGRAASSGGREKMRDTRREVLQDWHATAEILRKQGEARLAAQVERFTVGMPAVQTDMQRLTDRWSEAERSRALERANAQFLVPQAR
ncbi:hypothetical protein D9M69_723170 [compost metagenome]